MYRASMSMSVSETEGANGPGPSALNASDVGRDNIQTRLDSLHPRATPDTSAPRQVSPKWIFVIPSLT